MILVQQEGDKLTRGLTKLIIGKKNMFPFLGWRVKKKEERGEKEERERRVRGRRGRDGEKEREIGDGDEGLKEVIGRCYLHSWNPLSRSSVKY